MTSVLYEDAHCLAMDKPAGLLTQGLAGREPTLEDAARRHLRPDDPATAYLGTVHRLDRPASGVVLWAKTPRATRRLSGQFASRDARKVYWAIVEGVVGSGPGVWDDFLADPDETGVARVIDTGKRGGRRAITRFEVDAATEIPEGLAWLRLYPETGRTHQIRAQAAARGLPIVGDSAYGSTRAFPLGIALHARELSVEHPATHRRLIVAASPPASWAGHGIVLPGS